MSTADLAILEAKVAAEYSEMLAERVPGNPFDPSVWVTDIDWATWADVTGEPLLEMPREHWVVLPAPRVVALTLLRRVIPLIREKPDDPKAEELFQQAVLLFMYGGKVRIA